MEETQVVEGPAPAISDVPSENEPVAPPAVEESLPVDLIQEETPAEAIAASDSTSVGVAEAAGDGDATPANAPALSDGTPAQADAPTAVTPFVPDFNSPEVQALRAQLAARRAEQAAEAMTLEEALGVLPLRIRGAQFYIQEPTVRQEFLLRKHLSTLGVLPRMPGVAYPEPEQDAEKAELALVEAIRPFVCRYVTEKRDIEPITAEEAPDILGRRAIRDVIRAVFGAPAAGSDPNV